jgi:cardiolipin synthase
MLCDESSEPRRPCLLPRGTKRPKGTTAHTARRPTKLTIHFHSKTLQKITALRSKITGSKIKHEKVWNLPNTLTFGRLFASPVIGYLILHDQHVAALSLFALAGITDVVDGWIARNYNLQTVVGSVIDPMADKTLMTILTVCLAVKGVLPLWCATIILGRDVALAISAIYFRWISLPPPKTMARYWDFSLPSAEVHPTTISKLNTALQLALIGACVVNPLIGNNPDWAAALEAMQ